MSRINSSIIIQLGMEATSIFQIAKAVYSLLSSMNSVFEQKAIIQLEKAHSYLSDPNANESLIRHALQHMETAATLLNSDSVFDAKQKRYNDLCYYIAKIHYDLGDSYTSSVLGWAKEISCEQVPPPGFEFILKKEDWRNLIEAYERYQEYAQNPTQSSDYYYEPLSGLDWI